jgi:hypothetical protein
MIATGFTQPVTRDEVRVSSFLAGLNNLLFVQVTYEPLNLVVTSTDERDESAAVARCLELINRMQSRACGEGERRSGRGRRALAGPRGTRSAG